MTATDELRRLLDERGVKWEAPMSFDGTARYDTTAGGYWFHEFNGKITIHGLTPEQAIAATLGPGTCQADETDTWECVCDGIGHYGERVTVHVMECSECGRTYEHVNGGYECCPHCGRRIVEVDDG